MGKAASKQDKFPKQAQNDTKLCAIGTGKREGNAKSSEQIEIFGKDLRENTASGHLLGFPIPLLNIFIKFFVSSHRVVYSVA